MTLFSRDEAIIFGFPGYRILPIPDLSSIRALAPIVIILLIIFRSMEFLVLDSTEMVRSAIAPFFDAIGWAHSNALSNPYTGDPFKRAIQHPCIFKRSLNWPIESFW